MEEKSGDLQTIFRHRIKQPHADFNRQDDPQADPFGIPRS
jgi:hypothetical protein